jgi:hypothetical protein
MDHHGLSFFSRGKCEGIPDCGARRGRAGETLAKTYRL